MKRTRTLTLLATLLTAPAAAAHEQGGRAMGVVESVTAQQLVVKTADGHSVAFTVTPETRFFRGEKPARREDVQVGQRAVIRGTHVGERLRADTVKLGAAKAPR
ncbi:MULTISPECIES: DUF5666 domain-containing protein [unclassified Anaeromyxobacter]|uniref:DUF5666 domain-containing protein n=1 Tax=unclassified Anaeromyxobacter TaxID=2620896 RepID=UPI001F55F6E7|nr:MULTISPECIES: DUF5666 domain-containing protein [unclassified Anaeromyxobacter]